MKTIIRSSFKGELLLGFLFVAMVPLILSAAFLVKILENRINAEYKERVEAAISESSKEITKYVDDIDKICIEIAKDADIVTGLTEEEINYVIPILCITELIFSDIVAFIMKRKHIRKEIFKKENISKEKSRNQHSSSIVYSFL